MNSCCWLQPRNISPKYSALQCVAYRDQYPSNHLGEEHPQEIDTCLLTWGMFTFHNGFKMYVMFQNLSVSPETQLCGKWRQEGCCFYHAVEFDVLLTSLDGTYRNWGGWWNSAQKSHQNQGVILWLQVGGGFKYFFSTLPGEMILFD